jgi:hypothetical protein
MGSVKTDKTFYSHEKLCNFFYSEALMHCAKVFAKSDQCWSLSCEANGLTKRLVLKSKDRSGYLSLFINRTSLKATAVARNRMGLDTLWSYLHDNGADIILADFDKYILKGTSMKRDFADAIECMNALIDYTVAGFEYTGYAAIEHFPDMDKAYDDLCALQNNMKEVASQPILRYGVHTKKEYDSMMKARESQTE